VKSFAAEERASQRASVVQNEDAVVLTAPPAAPRRFNLDSVGKSIALAGSGCLVISVIYDWGYIHALGLSFATLPTSLADHLRGALKWLPATIMTLVGAAIFEVFNRRIEGGLSEAELLAKSTNPKKLQSFRNSPDWFARIIAIFVVLVWLLFGDFFQRGLDIVAPFLWLTFSLWIIRPPRLRAQLSKPAWIGFLTFPAIIIFAYLHGGYDAHLSLVDTSAPIVQLVPGSESLKSPLHLMRTFERFSIVRDDINSVSLIPTSDIKIIQPLRQRPFRGFLCEIWSRTCVAINPSKTP
jgi:hypothetical protein